jgi:hypothetical protein
MAHEDGKLNDDFNGIKQLSFLDPMQTEVYARHGRELMG